MSPKPPFVLDDFLPYQMAVVADRVSRQFARHYKEKFGLSRAEWRVVAHLSQQSSVSVREIAARAELEKSKVSRAVTRLESQGFITKTVSAADRRLVDLALTDKGRAMVETLAPIARDYQEEVLHDLAGDADSFRRALSRLMAQHGEVD